MDFFAQQEAARRKSIVLSVLAVLSVIPIVLLTACAFEAAFWGVYHIFTGGKTGSDWQPLVDFALSNRCQSTAVSTLVATLIVVVSGTVAFLDLLSGEAIMNRVGARKARREEEAVLVNVAEEMSLASGAALPSLWVLDSAADINAFAAGYSDGDAALCVTAGALGSLTRDELQGVVAHEFGHILNGDMRLNTRLAALVEGLSGISVIGSTMLQLFNGNDDEDERSWGATIPGGLRGKSSGGLVGPIPLMIVYVLLGGALWTIGLVGKGFASLLQLAVSREREYLADAAAVQFTRNPEGLADALRFSLLLRAPSWRAYTATAANISHMFFLGESWSQATTHPPVASRIAKLSSAGVYAHKERFAERLAGIRAARERKAAENFAKYERQRQFESALKPKDVKLPVALCARLRDANAAGEILCALLRGENLPECPNGLTSFARRVVASRAVGAIRQWGTPEAMASWSDRLEAIMEEDGVIDSFEFMVSCAIRRKLRPVGIGRRVAPARLAEAAAGVVSTIAAFGANGDRAYELAGRRLRPYLKAWPARPEPYESVRILREALSDLCALLPLVKRELLEALKRVIAEDGEIVDDEANYLAAVADAIGAYGWQLI